MLFQTGPVLIIFEDYIEVFSKTADTFNNLACPKYKTFTFKKIKIGDLALLLSYARSILFISPQEKHNFMHINGARVL